MTRIILSLAIALSALWLADSIVSAQNRDDRQQQAKQLLEMAEALAKDGHPDAAEKLKRKAHFLLEGGKQEPGSSAPDSKRQNAQHELGKQLHSLREQQQKLEQSGASEEQRDKVRRAIAETEEKLKHVQGAGHGPGKPGTPGDIPEDRRRAMERIEHVRQAAEHLHAAGLHDVADKLMEQAMQMEQELRQMVEKQEAERAGRDRHAGPQQEIEHLRSELKKAHAELEKLRQKQEK